MDSSCAFCNESDPSVLGSYLKVPMKFGGDDRPVNRIVLCDRCKANFESEFNEGVWRLATSDVTGSLSVDNSDGLTPTWSVSTDDAEAAILETIHRSDISFDSEVPYGAIVDAVESEFSVNIDPTQVGLVMNEYEIETARKHDGTRIVDEHARDKLPRGFPTDSGEAQVSMSVPGLDRGGNR